MLLLLLLRLRCVCVADDYMLVHANCPTIRIIADTAVTHMDALLHGISTLYGWRRGAVVSGVRRMNEVNARRARLVPGWVTVFGRVYHLGM